MPTAYFLLNVKLNRESIVIEEVKKILSTTDSIEYEVQGVFGVYDVIVKISSDNDDKLRQTALEKIRSIDGILSAITMMVNDAQV